MRPYNGVVVHSLLLHPRLHPTSRHSATAREFPDSLLTRKADHSAQRCFRVDNNPNHMDTKPNGEVASVQNASTSAKVLPDDTAEQSNVKEEWDSAALKPHEIFWKNKQKWLEEKGYRLRPRYAPEWVPSWQSSGKDPKLCEDGLASIVSITCPRLLHELISEVEREFNGRHTHI